MKRIMAVAASAILRIFDYLDRIGIREHRDRFPELTGALQVLDDEGIDLVRHASHDPDSPYAILVSLLSRESEKLRPMADSLLSFSVAAYLYPRFPVLLDEIHGHGVTTELAFFMENAEQSPYGDLRILYEQAALLLNEDRESLPFFHISFQADDRILGYLCGDNRIDPRLDSIVEISPSEELPPLMADQDLCAEVENAVRQPDTAVILQGGRGRGKKFLLCHAIRQAGQRALWVDTPQLLRQYESHSRLLWLLQREAQLLSCGIAFHSITKELLEKAHMSETEFLVWISEPFRKHNTKLYFCCDEHTNLIPYLSMPANQFVLPPLTRSQRILLWEGYAARNGIPLDAEQLGIKYRFTPDEIRKACLRLKTCGNQSDPENRQTAEILRSVLPSVISRGKVEPFHRGCTLDSLVLSDENRQKLREICAHVRYSHKVYDDWDMESKYAYGKAVSVLLSGPPGTGKTMTARVLSDLLQLPLYHVNLSQLVDKYIGETEKHLEEVFDVAERGNMILFFDEADSVFGKRSEVSDSHDRYANTEVSYILQRIEAYEGVVILATNYIQNIDSAFMRRMKYVLAFQLPGEEERKVLWQNCFPPNCPTRNIDFDYLAAQFEFSGSEIKNAVLSASFLAADEGEHTPIGMRHIISGVKNEYQKRNKSSFPTDFGKYAYLY